MTTNNPAAATDISVQTVCNLLARTKLMAPDDVRSMFARWRGEVGTNLGDTARFRKWLVANHYVTDYQADRLFRGQTDHYFLNQYKLLERLGQGRMAGVYRAVHQLGQAVAIKVLPPSKSRDANSFARFSREARLAVKLKHPNVVRTFQTGESGGLYYLVMENLEGETLKEVLQRRGKLPPPEAVRLVYQALLGLQHIHEQSLVHRDLEPGNLLLVPGWQPGQPDTTTGATLKILDIGLGRVVFDEDLPEGGPQLTSDGAILGTPDYMAPEQARNAHTADIRADVYSLGCVLYHALSGKAPFADKNTVKVMIRHATEPPGALKAFSPAVSDELQHVVFAMMAKDPGQRFPTPDRAAQALKPFLGGTQVQRAQGDDARMQAYLQWLAANPDPAEAAAPAPAPAAPPATVAWQAVPPPAALPAVPPPAEIPAPQVAAPYGPPVADVELVPAAAPRARQDEGFTLSPRDWLFLGVGAGLLVVGGVVMWLLMQ